MTAISFILPTLNEAENIARLISELDSQVCLGPKEFIVVDDGSTDGTCEKVEELSERIASITLIRRTAHPGLTVSLQEGIEKANGELVSWMDCDLSMPPEKLNELIEEIRRGADIAIGSRFVPGGGSEFVHGSPDTLTGLVLSHMLNAWIVKMLGEMVHDYSSGFIVAKREVFEKIRLRGDYGEYFIHLMHSASKNDFIIREVPYILRAREFGKGKTASSFIGYIRRGIKYVMAVIRLKVL